MKRACAWCRRGMGEAAGDGISEQLITHGLCDACAFRLNAQVGMPLRRFLDGLGAPVLLVDDEVRVRTANDGVQKLLRKDLPAIENVRGGEVFECEHAAEPGGCGGTFHCSGCAVRNAVMDTLRTGRSHFREPAFVRCSHPDGTLRLGLLISTERVNDIVLLRIDEARAGRLVAEREPGCPLMVTARR